MRMNLVLELMDVPGQLVKVLEPIGSLGANLVTVIHKRDYKTENGKVPVQLTLEGEFEDLKNVVKRFEDLGITITEMDDVVLKENNVIEDSEINRGCCIINSKIEKSKIGSHSYVMAYCNILNNSIIGNYCTIKSYVEIDNFEIEDNKTIESYTKLINGEKTE